MELCQHQQKTFLIGLRLKGKLEKLFSLRKLFHLEHFSEISLNLRIKIKDLVLSHRKISTTLVRKVQ